MSEVDFVRALVVILIVLVLVVIHGRRDWKDRKALYEYFDGEVALRENLSVRGFTLPVPQYAIPEDIQPILDYRYKKYKVTVDSGTRQVYFELKPIRRM